MDIGKIKSFLKRPQGIISATTVFFPFFDQVTKIVYVPALNNPERILLATINSLICSFVLLVCFRVQSKRRNLTPAFLMFIVGVGSFLGYEYLISPIRALLSLGIAADITYLSNYPIILYRILYWLIFASLTGAFTSISAFSTNK